MILEETRICLNSKIGHDNDNNILLWNNSTYDINDVYETIREADVG